MTGYQGTGTDRIQRIVTEALQGRTATIGELVRDTGMRRRQVYVALSSLNHRGKVEGAMSAGRFRWKLTRKGVSSCSGQS